MDVIEHLNSVAPKSKKMEFIKTVATISGDTITWNALPYQLQAVSFINIVSIATDNNISDITALIPGQIPYFLFECMDLHGHVINIISDGQVWRYVKRRANSKDYEYKITKSSLQLTTNDQLIIVELIKSICKNLL